MTFPGNPATSPDDPHFCSDFEGGVEMAPAHDFDDDEDEVDWDADDRHRRLR